MAALSDQFLIVTIMAYVVAMLLHAVEYSFGQRGAVARIAQAPARELVGAGAPVPLQPADPPVTAPAAGWAGRDKAELAGRAALAVTWIAVAAHTVTLVTRGLAAGRIPW